MFEACLVENPSVQVVCFENHAEWIFCLAPFVCRALLAHWRLVGAVAPERVVPSFGFLLVHMRASVEHSS